MIEQVIKKKKEIMSHLKQVGDDEVKAIDFEMNLLKALRPDDFPSEFYQRSQNTVGDKACELMKKIWKNPSEIMNINQTDICLIPKVEQP